MEEKEACVRASALEIVHRAQVEMVASALRSLIPAIIQADNPHITATVSSRKVRLFLSQFRVMFKTDGEVLFESKSSSRKRPLESMALVTEARLKRELTALKDGFVALTKCVSTPVTVYIRQEDNDPGQQAIQRRRDVVAAVVRGLVPMEMRRLCNKCEVRTSSHSVELVFERTRVVFTEDSVYYTGEGHPAASKKRQNPPDDLETSEEEEWEAKQDAGTAVFPSRIFFHGDLCQESFMMLTRLPHVDFFEVDLRPDDAQPGDELDVGAMLASMPWKHRVEGQSVVWAFRDGIQISFDGKKIVHATTNGEKEMAFVFKAKRLSE